MSSQADDLNKFARQHHGHVVDEAAGAAGKGVLLPGPQGGDGGEQAKIPKVTLPGRDDRDLGDFAQDLGEVLSTAPIFRCEDVVVTVDPDTGLLKIMTPDRFLTWVRDYAIIVEDIDVGRGQKRTTIQVRRTMPLTAARGCLASDAFYYKIRPLARVHQVRMPVMRNDGRVVLLPEGYDDESQIYTLPSSIKIDEEMTLEKAVGLIRSYYGGFPWMGVDPTTGPSRSMSVAITQAVALFGIALQSVEAARLGFMTKANGPGCGKSLVAQMAITATFGLPENTPKSGEDELRKVLDMTALQGACYLFFDNLKNHVESALLEGFMTSPVWAGRLMGSQRGFKAKKSTVLLITGNNLSLSSDLQRRVLQCDLFVKEHDLQDRPDHERDLNPVVLNRPEVRSEFLSALWAFIRNWDTTGRPKAGDDPKKPFRVATFAEWSDIFGGIVQAAGFGNPLIKPDEEHQADKKTIHQRQLVECLGHEVGSKHDMVQYTFQEVVDCMVENEFFTWLIEGRQRSGENGKEPYFELNSKSSSVLGLILTKEMAGREFRMGDGRRVLFKKEGDGRQKRYQVELVSKAIA